MPKDEQYMYHFILRRQIKCEENIGLRNSNPTGEIDEELNILKNIIFYYKKN